MWAVKLIPSRRVVYFLLFLMPSLTLYHSSQFFPLQLLLFTHFFSSPTSSLHPLLLFSHFFYPRIFEFIPIHTPDSKKAPPSTVQPTQIELEDGQIYLGPVQPTQTDLEDGEIPTGPPTTHCPSRPPTRSYQVARHDGIGVSEPQTHLLSPTKRLARQHSSTRSANCQPSIQSNKTSFRVMATKTANERSTHLQTKPIVRLQQIKERKTTLKRRNLSAGS